MVEIYAGGPLVGRKVPLHHGEEDTPSHHTISCSPEGHPSKKQRGKEKKRNRPELSVLFQLSQNDISGFPSGSHRESICAKLTDPGGWDSRSKRPPMSLPPSPVYWGRRIGESGFSSTERLDPSSDPPFDGGADTQRSFFSLHLASAWENVWQRTSHLIRLILSR